ncbi:hypothetical protein D1007_01753 [Hordeum vulgare]|nr:hypothetical protein D1007_01753 [Hordeum vulgare]
MYPSVTLWVVFLCFLMNERLMLLNWNVRGLNDPARRLVVKDLVNKCKYFVLCLQERKLSSFTEAHRAELGGPGLRGSIVLRVNGTRGGILLLWDESMFVVDLVSSGVFSNTTRMVPCQGLEQPWYLTTVYGPVDAECKQGFLDEIGGIHANMNGAWCNVGDFNLIKDPTDKNNDRINGRWMSKFRAALNSSSLREILLIGRSFTWSNEQSRPTLVRMDRAFCNVEWELCFPTTKLLPQATAMSDHCPLLLVNDALPRKPRRFHFEEYWRFLSGFKEVVKAAW